MKTISWDSIPDPDGRPLRKTRSYLDARSTAVAYIGIGRKTTGRVRVQLLRKGHPDEMAGLVVSDLVEEGILDDMAYGQALIRSRTGAGTESILAMRSRMLRLGLDSRVIENLLAESPPPDDVDSLLALLRKKYARDLTVSGKIPADAPPGLAARMMRFLCGRGFPYERVRETVTAMTDIRLRGDLDDI